MFRQPHAAIRWRGLAALLLILSGLGCTSVGRLIVAPTPTPSPPPPVLVPTATPTPTPSPTTVPTPTWTPTPTETPVPTPTPEPPTPTPIPVPQARAREEQVNVRAGPGVTFPRIGQIGRGEVYDILATNLERSWYQICCLPNGQEGWVNGALVEITGPTEFLAVLDIPTPPPTEPPPPTDTPEPTPTPAPLFYRGEGPIFMPTTNDWVTLWIKVYDRFGSPLPGWRLQIRRNGVVYATTPPSRDVLEYSAPPGFGNRKLYNLKYEIPAPGIADWEVYLIDNNGQIQSPIVPFTTTPTNPNREIYIAFLFAQ